MDTLNLLLTEILIWKYIILVIVMGAFLSKDGLLDPLPDKIRLVLLAVNKFYRVALISALLAVLYWKLEPETPMLNLLISFAFANTFYEMGVKKLFER